MNTQTDIIISGGGIAGLTLSLLLAKLELSVSVIEPHPPKKSAKPNGRTIALMNSSLNILKNIEGVWDLIEDKSARMEMMRIIDISRPTEDAVRTEFPASDIGLEQFGYNIPNQLLRSILYDLAAQNEHITLHKSALIDFTVNESQTYVKLENGHELTAKLIVGADGRSSKVRELADIKSKRKTYDQAALTFVINHSHAHNNISTEFHKPHGPLAFVPLPGNQSSIVWVENLETAEELKNLSAVKLAERLEDKSNHLLGGITIETKPESWPLCTIKAKSLSVQRCALIAEAAHVMSPITAQGLNLSLRDVAALAESIADHARLGIDIGSGAVLKTYEKRRSTDVETRVFGVDKMNEIVSSQRKTIKELRRFGLKALDVLPAVKTLSMQVGLAPQMDIGRLAKGEPL